MRFERIVDKAPAGSPQACSTSATQIAAPVCASLCLLATIALWTLVWAPAGLQQLLLLCLVRLAVLVCISAASYRALVCGRRAGSSSSGSSSSCTATPAASPRTSLLQAALCLQFIWLATELLLGSALLLFHPYLLGPPLEYAPSTAALLSVLPLVCAATMSGCFLFLQRLTSRRRRSSTVASSGRAGAAGVSPRCAGLECGLGLPLTASSSAYHQHSHVAQFHAAQHYQQQQSQQSQQLHLAQQQQQLHLLHSACCSAHPAAAPSCSSSLDGLASPALSDSGSFSSCSSSAASVSSASYYGPTPYGSSDSAALLGGSSGSGGGGAPSPTGHVRCCGSAASMAQAQQEAVLQAMACEILLVEHQLDTNEYCLFVHKRLRPIRTRPEDPRLASYSSKPAPPAVPAAEKPGLLRELITNSFTFQHDPELRAQLAASMVAATSAGGSGPGSITFQQAALVGAAGVGVI